MAKLWAALLRASSKRFFVRRDAENADDTDKTLIMVALVTITFCIFVISIITIVIIMIIYINAVTAIVINLTIDILAKHQSKIALTTYTLMCVCVWVETYIPSFNLYIFPSYTLL